MRRAILSPFTGTGLCTALWLLLSLTSSALLAAPPSTQPEKLYHVELVIFAQTDSHAGAEETWPLPQGLKYPENWQVLDDLDSGQEADADLMLTDTDMASQTAARTQPEQLPSRAWTSLPQAAWQLKDSAGRLSRSGRYRILTHQAWLQPLARRNEAPALLLSAGERFGDHFELEGYVTLARDRFVHAAAELWLSRFRFGDAMEASLFSPLPIAPQRQSTAQWGSGWLNKGDSNSLSSHYVANQVFVMRQSHRIEPGKLQYFDHPMLGMLLWVEAVEPPEQTPDETL